MKWPSSQGEDDTTPIIKNTPNSPSLLERAGYQSVELTVAQGDLAFPAIPPVSDRDLRRMDTPTSLVDDVFDWLDTSKTGVIAATDLEAAVRATTSRDAPNVDHQSRLQEQLGKVALSDSRQLDRETVTECLTEDGAYVILKARRRNKSSSSKSQPRMPRHTLLLYVISEATSLLYAGIIFGWAPMLLILTKNEWFLDHCSPGEKSCDAQSQTLSIIFSVAAMGYGIGGTPIGSFLDNAGKCFTSNEQQAGIYGAQLTALVAALLTCLGFYLFGMSNPTANPPIAVAIGGYTCIGLGGMAYFLLAFKMPDQLPARHQGLACSLLTTLGDASSGIFLLFELLFDTLEVSLWTISFVWGMLSLVISAALIVLWGMHGTCGTTTGTPTDEGLPYHDEDERERGCSGSPVSYDFAVTGAIGRAALTPQKLEMNCVRRQVAYRQRLVVAANLMADNVQAADIRIVQEKRPLQKRSAAQQIMTFEYFFILMFGIVNITRSTLYLSIMQPYIESDSFNGYSTRTQKVYVNIISFLIPCGVIFAPSIEPGIRRFGLAYYNILISIAGILFTCIAMVPNVLPVQVVAAIVFTFYRANTFAFPGQFNTMLFGFENMGTLTGLLFTVNAPFLYILTPALDFAQTTCGGNFVPLFLILIGFQLVSAVLSIPLLRSSDQLVQWNPRTPMLSPYVPAKAELVPIPSSGASFPTVPIPSSGASFPTPVTPTDWKLDAGSSSPITVPMK